MSAALSVALLSAGGYWLDRRFGLRPILTVSGLILGCVLAAASLRRLLVRLDRRNELQRSSGPKRKPNNLDRKTSEE
jgi:F0F1-type ATP synthase assembly protein I